MDGGVHDAGGDYENEVKQAAKQAAKQTKLDTFAELVRDGLIGIEVAAERAGVSAEEMAKLAAEVH